jgi:hypothetical protein
MRWNTLIALSALAAVAVAGCEQRPKHRAAAPGSSTSATANQNAADVYRSAWSQIGEDLNVASASLMFSASGVQMEPTGGSWDKLVSQLRDNQPAVADLLKASAMERCDFDLPQLGSNPSEGEFAPVLDLTGRLRKAARVLRADAVRAWMDGDTDGAVDRMVALYGLCRHASRPPILVVALTDAALLGLANDTVKAMAGGAAGKSLSAAQRQRLREAISRLDDSDPAGLVRARKAEGDGGQTQQLNQAQQRLTTDLAATTTALGR